jgi:type II secretory pathway component PulM
MLLALAAVAAAVLAWLAIVRPLSGAREAAAERHEAAVFAQAEARVQARDIAVLQKAEDPQIAEPLEALVGGSATEAGFRLSKMEPLPAGNAVTIGIESAKAEALFGWIARMEAEKALIVDRLAVTANADRTLAAQVTFRQKGR